MPATRMQRARVMAHAWAPWRKLWPNRTVRRRIQGVELALPWSHVLPDYARARPWYGQNLVDLAEALARRSQEPGPLRVLDIGANIGDSALQIINRVDARVLCVEGDPYWARFLRLNTESEGRVEREEVLLTPTDEGWGDVRAVRGLGTTKFEAVQERDAAAGRVSVSELRARHPDFATVRLVKSDTDGFDPLLVPAVAREWSDSNPVLFFEHDPAMAREVSEGDPNRVWEELAELGYSRLAIWDNTGDPLGQLDISQARTEAGRLEPRPVDLGYFFWDVAACRSGDSRALAAFDELIPGDFDPTGRGARSR